MNTAPGTGNSFPMGFTSDLGGRHFGSALRFRFETSADHRPHRTRAIGVTTIYQECTLNTLPNSNGVTLWRTSIGERPIICSPFFSSSAVLAKLLKS